MFVTLMPLRCVHIYVLVCPRGQLAGIVTLLFQTKQKQGLSD